jgi:hypothetical protein
MMNMKTTTGVAIVSLLFAIAGFAACGYMVYVTARMGSEITSRAQTIADNNEKIQSLKSMKEVYERSSEEREELSGFALTEDEAGDFLTEIERLGKEQGVSITTGALKVEKKKDTPDQLAVEFVIEGSEAQVRNVMSLLETLPYPSLLASATLAVEPDKKAKSTVKVLITLVKYDR